MSRLGVAAIFGSRMGSVTITSTWTPSITFSSLVSLPPSANTTVLESSGSFAAGSRVCLLLSMRFLSLSTPMQVIPATSASESIVPEPQNRYRTVPPFLTPLRFSRSFASLEEMEILRLTTGLSFDRAVNCWESGT